MSAHLNLTEMENKAILQKYNKHRTLSNVPLRAASPARYLRPLDVYHGNFIGDKG